MTRSQSFSLVRLMRARLRAFADETRGSVTVEAAIMLPLLVYHLAQMVVAAVVASRLSRADL